MSFFVHITPFFLGFFPCRIGAQTHAKLKFSIKLAKKTYSGKRSRQKKNYIFFFCLEKEKVGKKWVYSRKGVINQALSSGSITTCDISNFRVNSWEFHYQSKFSQFCSFSFFFSLSWKELRVVSISKGSFLSLFFSSFPFLHQTIHLYESYMPYFPKANTYIYPKDMHAYVCHTLHALAEYVFPSYYRTLHWTPSQVSHF